MLSLVFKKLNLCPVMPASRGVNPLATSNTVEYSSRICLHSWSHDKPILFLIREALKKNIESLTAVRPTLNPPLSLNAFFSFFLFFFLFRGVRFLLIGLLSKA